MRIEPEDGVLDVDAGKVGTLDYKVFGTLEGGDDRSRDHRSLGVLRARQLEGRRLRSERRRRSRRAETDPRGGVLTVQATAANSDGTTTKIETSLTVRYHATPADPRDDGSATFKLPKNPASLFDKAKADDAQNPELVYPNDGVVLPPNLHRLSVHFRPGSDNNQLFEVSFDSAGAEIVYYVRCGELVEDGCALELDGDSFQLLADSNRDGVPVQLQVRGTDDKGVAVGSSEVFELSFARTDVRGGLYYWRTDRSGRHHALRFRRGRDRSGAVLARGRHALEPSDHHVRGLPCDLARRHQGRRIRRRSGQRLSRVRQRPDARPDGRRLPDAERRRPEPLPVRVVQPQGRSLRGGVSATTTTAGDRTRCASTTATPACACRTRASTCRGSRIIPIGRPTAR